MNYNTQMINNQNVPKLRFKEFSGEWEEKRLGNLGSFQGGGTPNRANKNYWHGEIPWISSSDIYEDNIHQISINHQINETAILESATKKIPKNSLLFVSRVGVGKIAINSVELCTSQDFTNFYPTQSDSFFLGYYFLANKKVLQNLSQGTSIKGFTKNDLETFQLFIPQVEEQQKIASFLSTVDTKIDQLTRKKELIEQYKKGVMQKIFSQELRFKTDDGSEFPEWEEKKLGEISNVKDGTHDSPKYTNVGYPLLTSKNLLTNGKLDFENINLISEEDYISINKRSKVDIGDILFGMIGTIGNPVLIQEDGFAIKNVALIKEKDTLLNIFLIHYLKSIHLLRQFYQQNTGGTQKFIALGVIRDFLISVPCIDEQTKIADFLSAIDSKIDLVTKQLNEAKNFKKGLLQQMFV